MITKDRILKQFEYDRDKGILISRRLNRPITANNGSGYLEVKIDKKKYYVHHLIYFLENNYWVKMIDHKDRNPSNNHFSNLRGTTPMENQGNQKISKGSSKYKGVYWNKQRQKWVAEIHVNYKKQYLGIFTDEEEAAKTYDKAALKHFREFANLNLN